MKKDLKVASQEDIAIIESTLRDILKLYSPFSISDQYNITIYTHNDLSIIIKMLNPFANGKSYFLLCYITTDGSDEKSSCIFSQVISYINDDEYSASINLAITQLIFTIIQSIGKSDHITIYTNLDQNKPSSVFELVGETIFVRDKYYMDDIKCEIAAYVASHLTERDDKMVLNLYLHLNKNTDSEIKSKISCYFQYNKIFNFDCYSIRLKSVMEGYEDQLSSYSTADEFIDGIKSVLDYFYKIASYTVDGETVKLSLFRESRRTKHV